MPTTATTIAITANFNLYSKLLPHMLPESKDISKIAAVNNSVYIILQKHFLGPKSKIVLPKQILRQEPITVPI